LLIIKHSNNLFHFLILSLQLACSSLSQIYLYS